MKSPYFGDLLRDARARAGLSQRALAQRARTSQSIVGRIEAGLVSPSFESMAKLLAAAGFELHGELTPIAPADPLIAAYKRDIDRTLLRENLSRTPEQRVRALQALVNLAEEAERAGRTLRAKRRRTTR